MEQFKTNNMKNPLLTLSALVSIESKKIEAIRKEYKERLLLWKPTPDVMGAIATSYDTICLHSELLGKTVEIKHFVACGEYGKPMEFPQTLDECSAQTAISCSQELEPCECQAYNSYKEQYQKALESVVFDGWEVDFTASEERGFFIKNTSIIIGFYFRESGIGINIIGRDTKIKSFADLAQATKANPLPLKPTQRKNPQ